MSARSGPGWQTSLADLSLILFMVTAAAVNGQSHKPQLHGPQSHKPQLYGPSKSQVSAAPSPQTEPLSVYIAAPDAPPLSRWLDEQAADPRQELTITAHYGSGGQSRALAEAARLLAEAGAKGRKARIVVEPGEGAARAVLAYDAPAGADSQGKSGTKLAGTR